VCFRAAILPDYSHAMDAQVIEIGISDSDVVKLVPVTFREDRGNYLIGCSEYRNCCSTSALGMRAIQLLRTGLTIGAVRERLRDETGAAEVTFVPLLEHLIALGAVVSIGSRPVPVPRRRFEIALPGLTRESAGWFFSPAMLFACALLLFGAALICMMRGWPFPGPAALLLTAKLSLIILVSFGIAMANVIRHEFAHGVAAAYLGITPRFRIGYRLFFPVIETDMTGLWMTEKRGRLFALWAGIASDVFFIALLVVCAAFLQVLRPSGFTALRILSVAFFTTGAQILWEFNIWFRTDIYYLIAAALNCRNLHGDAKEYLKALVRGRKPRRYFPPGVKTYAWCLVLGYPVASLSFAAYCIGVGKSVFTSVWQESAFHPIGIGPTAKAAIVAVFLSELLLLVWAKYSELHTRAPSYRIVMGASQ